MSEAKAEALKKWVRAEVNEAVAREVSALTMCLHAWFENQVSDHLAGLTKELTLKLVERECDCDQAEDDFDEAFGINQEEDV